MIVQDSNKEREKYNGEERGGEEREGRRGSIILPTEQPASGGFHAIWSMDLVVFCFFFPFVRVEDTPKVH
jgi:hypothetical protein